MERLRLTSDQTEDLLVALAPECALDEDGDGRDSTADLFRRLTTGDGWASFQWHPQRLAGRVQTVILRPDLTLEVWQDRREWEDAETTRALEPVRARLSELARWWALKEPEPATLPNGPGARTRLSALAERNCLPATATFSL